MALSGSVNTGSYEGRYYQLSWTATQSVTNNTSTISWTLKALGGSSSWYAERTLKVTIAGDTVYSKTNRVERWTGTVASGTKTITHGSDGSKSFAVNVQAAVYVTTVNCTASKTFTLDNIPRKSTLSVGNGTLNTAQTLTVTRQSSSFTHTITAKCGSASTTICTKSTSTSISFTPPLSWASQNTTGTSVSVTYTITTYNGSTSLGSNTYTKTCSIPSSVKPSVSFTVSDANNYLSTYGGYVQSKSKFKVTITASGSQSSTIKSYKTTADGKTYTSSSFTTDVVSGSGTLTINVTVTDSRGRTATASKTVSVLAYTPPKVSSVSVKRCNENGVSNSSGDYLSVTFSANITSLNSKNTAQYFVRYQKTGETSYTQTRVTDYDGVYSVTSGKYIFAADKSSSYKITVQASDAFTSVSKSTVGSSAKKLWSAFKRGLGFAFGKIAELENYLEVAFKTLFHENVEFINDKSIHGTDIDGTKYSALIPITASGNTSLGHGLYKAGKGNTHIYGNKVQFYTNDGIYANGNHLYFGNNRCIYGTKPNGDFYEVINFQNSNGNLVFGYDSYDNKNGQTNIYGHDVHIGVSNIASPGTFKPYFRQGDTISVNIHTAGYITNTKTELHFTIPLNKPIVGTPTISLSSTNGFTLRQEDKYTHGSSATVRVKPSSYTAYAYHGVGVRVIAEFSTTTNALNNAPIGIDWNGTITLS